MLNAVMRPFQEGGLRYSLALAVSTGAHLSLGLALAGGPLPDSGSPAAAARHLGALTVYLQAHQAAAPPSAAKPSPGLAAGTQSSGAAPDRLSASPAGAPPTEVGLESRASAALPEPYYYAPGELNQKPVVAQDIAPDMLRDLPDQFPQPARVQLLINERGEVDKVVVEESLLSEQAERFVTEVLEKIRFHPGRLDGAAVKSRLPIEVSLQSARAPASATQPAF